MVTVFQVPFYCADDQNESGDTQAEQAKCEYKGAPDGASVSREGFDYQQNSVPTKKERSACGQEKDRSPKGSGVESRFHGSSDSGISSGHFTTEYLKKL